MVLCLFDGSKIKLGFPKGGFPSPKQPIFSVYKLFLGKACAILDERFEVKKQAADHSCISSIFLRGVQLTPWLKSLCKRKENQQLDNIFRESWVFSMGTNPKKS